MSMQVTRTIGEVKADIAERIEALDKLLSDNSGANDLLITLYADIDALAVAQTQQEGLLVEALETVEVMRARIRQGELQRAIIEEYAVDVGLEQLAYLVALTLGQEPELIERVFGWLRDGNKERLHEEYLQIVQRLFVAIDGQLGDE